jgi:Uma2 family endonuclease
MVAEHLGTRRFTADEVWRMVETGVLHEDERVELIDGELIVMNPQGPVHATSAVRLHRVLETSFGPAFHVRDHSPVIGTVDSIPEPDVAVVHGELEAFAQRHPGPADVALIVEVSDSSLRLDRRKADVYATAGYAMYWIVDVIARRIEVHTEPKGGVYTKTEVVGDDGTVRAGERTLRVVEMLP